MHPLAYGIEQQVQVINDQRLRDALRAEQLRLARGERPNRIAAAANSVRSSVGSMLIAAGERLCPEPAQHPELESDPIDAVRHA